MGEPQQNPNRQYHGFRPRQAARGFGAVVGAVNKATVMLFNNSTGPHVLAVRNVSPTFPSSTFARSAYLQGTLGTHTGTEQALVTGDGPEPGQIFTVDTATTLNWDYEFQGQADLNAIFPATFAFAFLHPGWSLAIQCVGNAITPFNVAFIWEAISIDELDYI